jgi:hypothetical protein
MISIGYRTCEMARPGRFELPTPRFVVWCSIQLSYGRLDLESRGRLAPGSAVDRHKRARKILARPKACYLSRLAGEGKARQQAGAACPTGEAAGPLPRLSYSTC